MRNEFKHLDSGLTVLFCKNVRKKIIETVYMDTKMFSYISPLDIEWKIYISPERGERFYVGGTTKGRLIFLKEQIGIYAHNYSTDYQVSLINGNYFDLRSCNLFGSKPDTPDVLQILEKLKSTQLPLLTEEFAVTDQGKEKTVLPPKKKPDVLMQILDYEGNLLFSENNKIVNEIPKEVLRVLKGLTRQQRNQLFEEYLSV